MILHRAVVFSNNKHIYFMWEGKAPFSVISYSVLLLSEANCKAAELVTLHDKITFYGSTSTTFKEH